MSLQISIEQLIQLDEMRNTVLQVRISSKTFGAANAEYIQGQTTGGNISINGSSSVRRTGSLSMIATATNKNITAVDNVISINKIIKIEVGLQHNIVGLANPHWFNLGHFVISNASITRNTAGFNIQLSLKDLMAKVNGECGGMLPGGMTHSPIYVRQADGIMKSEPVQYEALIRTLMTEYTDFVSDDLIINLERSNLVELPDALKPAGDTSKQYGIKNTVRWGSSTEIYATYTEVSSTNDTKVWRLSTTESDDSIAYNFNDNIGYVLTEFVYPTKNDLTSNAGESVGSVLDKIKNSLGNYEYYFDVDGKFHFEQVPNGINAGSTQDDLILALAESYINPIPDDDNGPYYTFDSALLVNSYSNTPSYESIKNDLVVWGKRGDNGGVLRYRLLIDNKPTMPTDTSYRVVFYTDPYGIPRLRKPIDADLETAIETINITDTTDWRYYYYLKYVINDSDNPYKCGAELEEELPKIMDVRTGHFYASGVAGDTNILKLLNSMNYFIDIIDPNEIEIERVKNALNELTITKIGRRTKSIQNNDVNTLFNPQFPDVAYIEMGTDKTNDWTRAAIGEGWDFSQVPQHLYEHMEIGTAIYSAYDAIRIMLSDVLSYNNAISLQTIPIYHLDVNKLIEVEDDDTGIHGKYQVNSISVPLTPNGLMNITARLMVNKI